MASPLIAISRKLTKAIERLEFGPPTEFVYNPLVYAKVAHETYLERHGAGPSGRVLLLGMNPGPFGMAQTGVPFGDVTMVREFLGIEVPVGRPSREHPARPVTGFACKRSEVSGTRLWGWARDRYGHASEFFQRFFVVNYCPLVFMEAGGKNRTPDKLPASEQGPLFAACDEALAAIVKQLAPSLIVGVGAFAEGSARRAVASCNVRIGVILHPSPANPKANTGWGRIVDGQLRELGVAL